MADDNKLLGQFDLVGIPPSARGTPQIEVTFDIDANGIVKVSAQDKATGKEQQITIQSSGGLSESEVEKMVRDAKSNEESDKKRKKIIEVRNKADATVYQLEKSLAEHRSKLAQPDIDLIESELKNVKEAAENKNFTDADELEKKIEKLNQAAQKIGEAVYKKSGTSGPSGGAGAGAGAAAGGAGTDAGSSQCIQNGNTVDAEFEETQKKK